MRRAPLIDFICVLILLGLMGLGITLLTHKEETSIPTSKHASPNPSHHTSVEAKILFSHRPTHIRIQRADQDKPLLDCQPASNEIDLSLTLPAKQSTEFLIDIQWLEASENNKYFTQITLTQAGKEEQKIHFTDQFADFADTFEIDTR
ncbi:hypothetical protein HW115_07160 [Verrucomicrobiaceae bacterium N1E253]|uniref:Uncharacterized protein n=1 Tax=Oceaniferula marina TaxID=2748318 RepID=A0A851GMP9_9BACT|nr:hypothetical protein [Oceaniferula marina]NWK55384.1 hypothetical protein [Oceaniferula marina]